MGQLAEMTSKCYLPQPFTNDQSPALGGDPSSAKGQQGNTNSGAKQRPNLSPAERSRRQWRLVAARRSVGWEWREEQACEAQGRSLFDCADLSVRGPPGAD